MIQRRYKTKWRAFETIRRALKDGSLIAWYADDHYYVVNLRRFL